MTTKTLYISNNGRVACSKHGGGYLQSHLEVHPNAREISTPLDHWLRVEPEDGEEFDFDCETARYGNGLGGECA